LLIWLELTDDLKPFEIVPGSYSVRSTDFGTYLEEWDQQKERGRARGRSI
jgi:hypothetical protein